MTATSCSNPALLGAVDEIVDAARAPDRLDRIASVLRDITGRFHARGELIHEADDDEVLLHANDALTIYHITLTPGVQYPPHNHLMDALIGIYRGGETNFVYPSRDDDLGTAERREVSAPAVVRLPPGAVHSVANTGTARSGALHVYLGNLSKVQRQMWRFIGGGPEAFDNDRYLSDARPIELSRTEEHGAGNRGRVLHSSCSLTSRLRRRL